MAKARIEKFGEPVIDWTVKLTQRPIKSNDKDYTEGDLYSGFWKYEIAGSSLVEERKFSYSTDGYLSGPQAQAAAQHKMETITSEYRDFLTSGGMEYKVSL